jgi:hypothetical protein
MRKRSRPHPRVEDSYSLPANHPALATSSFNLAAVYLDQGDYVG